MHLSFVLTLVNTPAFKLFVILVVATLRQSLASLSRQENNKYNIEREMILITIVIKIIISTQFFYYIGCCIFDFRFFSCFFVSGLFSIGKNIQKKLGVAEKAQACKQQNP